MINNVDILLVKAFFDPRQAGLYAAVALVGRLLYFASWQVVSAMFPISAAAKPGEKAGNVLTTPVAIVSLISIAFVTVLWLAPKFIISVVFGPSFMAAESLFGLYAAATGLYALSVVLMTYEMSRRIANTGSDACGAADEIEDPEEELSAWYSSRLPACRPSGPPGSGGGPGREGRPPCP